MSVDEYPGYDWTLGDARDWLRDRVQDGAKCPCCTQFAKVYRRKLHAGMAVALIHMYRHRDADNKFDITTHMVTRPGDTSKLRYWELIERDDDDPEGVYRITLLGRLFVEHSATVPSHAEIYDGRLLKVDGEQITITQALGKKFDYPELMGTAGTVLP